MLQLLLRALPAMDDNKHDIEYGVSKSINKRGSMSIIDLPFPPKTQTPVRLGVFLVVALCSHLYV